MGERQKKISRDNSDGEAEEVVIEGQRKGRNHAEKVGKSCYWRRSKKMVGGRFDDGVVFRVCDL